ncbi:MAG: hypothetical protein KF722_12295 [Nitrospira sp.]|nr:hypothetical protein [Nitrospira sp.]
MSLSFSSAQVAIPEPIVLALVKPVNSARLIKQQYQHHPTCPSTDDVLQHIAVTYRVCI